MPTSIMLGQNLTLYKEPAHHITALIENLANLEARENAENLDAGREALARNAAGEEIHPWDEAKKRLETLGTESWACA